MQDRISLDLDELLYKSERLLLISDELDGHAQRLKSAARRLECECEEGNDVSEAAGAEMRQNARRLSRAADDALELARRARVAVESFAQCERIIRLRALDRYELEQGR